MGLGQAAHEGEPKSCARIFVGQATIQLHKWLKETWLISFRNANASVAHTDGERARRLVAFSAQFDAPAVRRKLDGIAQ